MKGVLASRARFPCSGMECPNLCIVSYMKVSKMIQVADILKVALMAVDVISGPEVTQLLRAADLPTLRTRALTDCMGAAGFGRIDRPRVARMVNRGGRSIPAPSWHVPGIGPCTVYVRNSAGTGRSTVIRAYGMSVTVTGHAAVVFDWIADRKRRIPDKRVTRFEDNPGRKTLAHAIKRESAFIRSRSSDAVPQTPVRAVRVKRGEFCATCGASAPMPQRTVCHGCALAWRKVHEYPNARSRAPQSVTVHETSKDKRARVKAVLAANAEYVATHAFCLKCDLFKPCRCVPEVANG